MFAQLLQRDFILGRMRRAGTVEGDLSSKVSTDALLKDLADKFGLKANDVQAALDALKEAAGRESVRQFDPIEEEAYIPKDPIVSLFQSCARGVLRGPRQGCGSRRDERAGGRRRPSGDHGPRTGGCRRP